MSDVQRLAIEGEFTIFTAAEIRTRLLDALDGGEQVEVDLSGVTEMDTAGLQIILASRIEASKRHKQLSFVGSSRAVADVMTIYGLAENFDPKLETGGVLEAVGAPA